MCKRELEIQPFHCPCYHRENRVLWQHLEYQLWNKLQSLPSKFLPLCCCPTCMETLYPIIFKQVRDLTSIQFTRTHILICIECWGRGGGRTQEMFWFYQQHTHSSRQFWVHRQFNTWQNFSLHHKNWKMVKKLELTLRNIDEKCFNIKKTKLKFVSWTSLKIKEKYNLSFQEHKTKENLNSH